MSEAPPVRVWRLVKSQYTATAFDGEGAFRYGGRWNSRGSRMVYASSSLALAALEFLVHLDPAAPAPELAALHLDIPAGDVADLPDMEISVDGVGIRTLPLELTRSLGDNWLRQGREVALTVPSAVVPLENNYLLNPNHPSFPAKIGPPIPFTYDPRVLRVPIHR